jgi:hypothetical protein
MRKFFLFSFFLGFALLVIPTYVHADAPNGDLTPPESWSPIPTLPPEVECFGSSPVYCRNEWFFVYQATSSDSFPSSSSSYWTLWYYSPEYEFTQDARITPVCLSQASGTSSYVNINSASAYPVARWTGSEWSTSGIVTANPNPYYNIQTTIISQLYDISVCPSNTINPYTPNYYGFDTTLTENTIVYNAQIDLPTLQNTNFIFDYNLPEYPNAIQRIVSDSPCYLNSATVTGYEEEEYYPIVCPASSLYYVKNPDDPTFTQLPDFPSNIKYLPQTNTCDYLVSLNYILKFESGNLACENTVNPILSSFAPQLSCSSWDTLLQPLCNSFQEIINSFFSFFIPNQPLLDYKLQELQRAASQYVSIDISNLEDLKNIYASEVPPVVNMTLPFGSSAQFDFAILNPYIDTIRVFTTISLILSLVTVLYWGYRAIFSSNPPDELPV